MRVYGVDFTCAPRRAKPITVASGFLKKAVLQVEDVENLETFAAFEAFLQQDGQHPLARDAERALVALR